MPRTTISFFFSAAFLFFFIPNNAVMLFNENRKFCQVYQSIFFQSHALINLFTEFLQSPEKVQNTFSTRTFLTFSLLLDAQTSVRL